jgi:hypothetical protein
VGKAVCTRCVHFRKVKPPSQLLAKAVGTADGPVAEALEKVLSDEQRMRETEAADKRSLVGREADSWETRPVMSGYCGFQEAEEIYLLAEVKNRGGGCPDFNPGRPERHACADCAQRVEARGRAIDEGHERAYTQMSVSAIAGHGSTSVPESLLTKYREGVSSRKALELLGAYHAQGEPAMEPMYLDWCRHFSSEDEYVICALRNPHNTCPAWSPAASGPASASAAPGVPAAVTADAPAPSNEAFDASLELLNFMTAEAEGKPAAPISPEARQAWREHLASTYPKLPPPVRAMVSDAPRLMGHVRRMWRQLADEERDDHRAAWQRLGGRPSGTRSEQPTAPTEPIGGAPEVPSAPYAPSWGPPPTPTPGGPPPPPPPGMAPLLYPTQVPQAPPPPPPGMAPLLFPTQASQAPSPPPSSTAAHGLVKSLLDAQDQDARNEDPDQARQLKSANQQWTMQFLTDMAEALGKGGRMKIAENLKSGSK